MRACSGKLYGILNGIDAQRYDPACDPDLDENFTPGNPGGKARDKRILQQALDLGEAPDVPLIGMVSRLVSHKGMDLICSALEEILSLDVQLVVLGKGDERYEQFFRDASLRHPDCVAARIAYNEQLGTKIYGGSDLYLMPSLSEPCGLSQMIAMRYGAVPVVRETGGLKDSVLPYKAESGTGNGFTFRAYDAAALLAAVRGAVDLYRSHPADFRKIQICNMKTDFSWNRSAARYLRLYGKVTGRLP